MKPLIVAALVGVATPAWAESVSMPLRIADGATWTLESSRVRADERKDGPRRTETKSRYRVTYRAGKDGEGRLTLDPMTGSALGDLPAGLDLRDLSFPLELDVDENLLPKRLRNWPQVRSAVYKVVGSTDPKIIEGVRGIFDSINDQQAVNMFVPQMAFLGQAQGGELEVGERLTYDDVLPNPLGGPSIKAEGAFTLTRHDAAAHEAEILWTQTLDKDSMAASMRVTMKILFERMKAPVGGPELEAAIRDAKFDRDSRCQYVIDTVSGLARKADCTATTVIRIADDGSRRVDTWTITQTPPEKR